ncbi:NAD-dependent epimerase/dehydratase family protein [Streptomyces sp. NL15-2K]|uniref:NAD-dependent epimerase/dehydratase family protein n=1 Tax=Streptomyces sp. NL15-2K TaxID=376149 RepID=UPI000F58D3E4|nr:MULTISPECIES: NAD-dependent epimerase/dehydratase family protein [Actinomycetes]WKX11332.1 NAD-dependent epimerase/dehydratase family protein [Kutzneria buriramensis]
MSAVVTGAGGFIGGHLVAALLRQGKSVRAVDIKPLDEWCQVHPEAENIREDVSLPDSARRAVRGSSTVYNLAADMGGMGFIENNRAACMLSVLTSTHVLKCAREEGVERFFYSSSACVYAEGRQNTPNTAPLRESDAYPAMPEDGYGWEKLFSERMCRHFLEDYCFQTRVARYHNIYGEFGTWYGGREKAPAALCRKVATAALTGEKSLRIWGDGNQTRTFTYIDDCVQGTLLITEGDHPEPVNLGSDEMVSINQVVDILEDIAGVRLERQYQLDAPQGVRGRSSDNTEIMGRYGWAPSTSLAHGLEQTYAWIYSQVKQALT